MRSRTSLSGTPAHRRAATLPAEWPGSSVRYRRRRPHRIGGVRAGGDPDARVVPDPDGRSLCHTGFVRMLLVVAIVSAFVSVACTAEVGSSGSEGSTVGRTESVQLPVDPGLADGQGATPTTEDCVADGVTTIEVPNVKGLALSDAIAHARQAGMNVIDSGVPSKDPIGDDAVVLVQEPPAGLSVPEGACIGFRTSWP